MIRPSRSGLVLCLFTAVLCLHAPARGTPVNFNNFTVENYTPTGGFGTPTWSVTDGGATAAETTNSYPTIFYGQQNVLNTRIAGTIVPGTDDDMFGLVVGFNPGDTSDGDANYLLLDWKAVTQGFNFTGFAADVTAGSTADAGLALSRVTGTPTADELWGHQDQLVSAAGGVNEIARARTLGSSTYARDGSGHQFEIFYEEDRLRVLVDGVVQFDMLGDFSDGRFGLFEHGQSPGATYTNFDISPFMGPPIPPVGGVVGANIIVPPGTNDWMVVSSTSFPNEAAVVSAPNGGDIEISFNSKVPQIDDGVMMATISENGSNVTVEAAANHTGWGNNRFGIATSPTPAGGEANANVAVAFFPFADGWIAGNVAPSANLVAGNGVIPSDVSSVPLPAGSGQAGLYNLTVAGVNSASDGLLFTIGSSNEDNIATSTPFQGGWRVAVRDNGSTGFAEPTNFENDDWGFVYVPINAGNLVGGRVSGFDANGDAVLDMSSGNFSLTRQAEGMYLLDLLGNGFADQGMLLLEANESLILSNGETAPGNLIMSYEGIGSQFLINLLQTQAGGNPTLVDGAFSFAFLDYNNPLSLDVTGASQGVPEPTTGLLGVIGFALLAGKRRRREVA